MKTADVKELRQIAEALNNVVNRLAVKDENPVKLEVLRAALVQKSIQGFSSQIRALLKKYGALKLTDVDPKYYADILAEAEGIDDAG